MAIVNFGFSEIRTLSTRTGLPAAAASIGAGFLDGVQAGSKSAGFCFEYDSWASWLTSQALHALSLGGLFARPVDEHRACATESFVSLGQSLLAYSFIGIVLLKFIGQVPHAENIKEKATLAGIILAVAAAIEFIAAFLIATVAFAPKLN